MKAISTESEGLTFTVEFTTGRPLRRNQFGKHWPLTTQCVVKRNGLVIGVGEVVKHEKDKENPKYARMYSAKKAFANADRKIWAEERTRLWKQILEL